MSIKDFFVKEKPVFTGISRGLGGFGFGVAAASSGSEGNLDASGGVIYTNGTKTIHRFAASGSFVVDSGSVSNAEVLVIGGGGSGGADSGAGGGAGAVLYGTSIPLAPGTYTVTVGDGGDDSTGYFTAPAATWNANKGGGNSQITHPGGNIIGGGGNPGGVANPNPYTASPVMAGNGGLLGSNGGAAVSATTSPTRLSNAALTTPYPTPSTGSYTVYRNQGGDAGDPSITNLWAGAGGGGAGGAGDSSSNPGGDAGNGGAGVNLAPVIPWIPGASTYNYEGVSGVFAGGGGAGSPDNGSGSLGGSAGSGGGGRGGSEPGQVPSRGGYVGRHGTGSGGGGGDGTGADGGAGGGNGVVYIAYDTADAVTDTESATVAATGGAATYTYNGYKVHVFTSTTPAPFNVSTAGHCHVILVGGGGAGGRNEAGGGGAGGYIDISGLYVPAADHTVTIGRGGNVPEGMDGVDSSLGSLLTAKGGGQGGQYPGGWGSGGGSAGGAAAGPGTQYGGATPGPGLEKLQTYQSGDSGAFGYGNNGGTGSGTTPYLCGGGGGAGGEGMNGGAVGHGGHGGTGKQAPSIFRDPSNPYGYPGPSPGGFWFAGGGGGGSSSGNDGTGGGPGGPYAGAGNGSNNPADNIPTTLASANSGSGGGGFGNLSGVPDASGAGGSGICLIAYKV